VLLEVGARALDGPLRGVVDAHAEAEDQILAELERAALAPRGLLIVADPALDELLGGGGDDAFDAVSGHEVETPRAAAHDGLPDLDRLAQGTRHQRDLLQRIAPIGDLRGERVVLPPMRERLLAERLQDDLHLLLEELAVGLGVQHRVAERLHLAGVVPASHPEHDPALGEDIRDRVVLGEAEGMPRGHHVEGATDLHALGAMGQVHRQHGDGRNALVPLVLEVMLGQPQRLVSQCVGGESQGHRGVEYLDQALVGIPAVVGGRARQPTLLQLDVADVEGREAGDHRGPA
jgi:hypothetical protein